MANAPPPNDAWQTNFNNMLAVLYQTVQNNTQIMRELQLARQEASTTRQRVETIESTLNRMGVTLGQIATNNANSASTSTGKSGVLAIESSSAATSSQGASSSTSSVPRPDAGFQDPIQTPLTPNSERHTRLVDEPPEISLDVRVHFVSIQ